MIVRPEGLPSAGPELLVALDVDGTIVHHDGALSPRVREGIQELDRRGAHVVIATGRGVVATTPILEELGLARGFAVSSNGAVTFLIDHRVNGGFEILETKSFDPEPVLRAMHRELPEALLMVEAPNTKRYVTGDFPEGELHGEPHIVTLDELVTIPAVRVTLRLPGYDSQAMHDLIERADLHTTTYAVGWTAWLDIAPDGVTKASGLDGVRERLGVSPSATVSVGDGSNDHEMFAWSAWSIAMGQATETTRSLADAVTGSVHEDGLADVIDSLLR